LSQLYYVLWLSNAMVMALALHTDWINSGLNTQFYLNLFCCYYGFHSVVFSDFNGKGE